MHGQRGVGGGVLCACAKRKGEGCSVPVKREMGGAVCVYKGEWGRSAGCLCKEEWK